MINNSIPETADMKKKLAMIIILIVVAISSGVIFSVSSSNLAENSLWPSLQTTQKKGKVSSSDTAGVSENKL